MSSGKRKKIAEEAGIEKLRAFGTKMTTILGLSGSPVGVKLLLDKESSLKAQALNRHRYCQALMRARRGQHVLLDGNGMACPAAAAAFGFRPLPGRLKSGKGLVAFGIVADAAVGKRMFETMQKLEPDRVRYLHLFPLDEAECVPDVVVVEGQVEKLMWISLAYLNARGGERIQSSTAVLQATCVDSTIIPYLENHLNLGYGCYGCRDATDLGEGEAVLGFPGAMLPKVVDCLEFLAEKAIPTSRSKRAWAVLVRKMVILVVKTACY